MSINFDFCCNKKTDFFYPVEDGGMGIEIIGAMKDVETADYGFVSGICGKITETDIGLIYYICPKCDSERKSFGAFPENIQEPVKTIKSKLESFGFEPLWLDDSIEIEYGLNISTIDNDEKAFYIHAGLSMDIDNSQEYLDRHFLHNDQGFILTSIKDEDCEFNIDCAKLFHSVDELTEDLLHDYEESVDSFIDYMLSTVKK